MSRSTSLTCQSKKACIVIRKNKQLDIDKIKSYCDTYFEKYAFIEHKRDVKPDTSEIETVHYHIVGNFKASKVAFSTRLNDIVEFFKFDNACGIEIEMYKSLENSIQYLTHKNQPEKTQHDVKDIVTNIEQSEFQLLYESDSGQVVTFDTLYCLCLESSNIIEVIKGLGIGVYKSWRNVIWDIWNELHKFEK